MSPVWLFLLACAVVVAVWLPFYVVLVVADPAGRPPRPRRYRSVINSVNRSLKTHGDLRVPSVTLRVTLPGWVPRRVPGRVRLDDLTRRVQLVENRVNRIFEMMTEALETAGAPEALTVPSANHPVWRNPKAPCRLRVINGGRLSLRRPGRPCARSPPRRPCP